MTAPARTTGLRLSLLALALAVALCGGLAGCARPGDPSTLRASFLGTRDPLDQIPHVQGISLDGIPLGQKPPEPVRTTVTFTSADADLYRGTPTILEAALFRPQGAGPFPAVVAMHGCLGLYGPTGAMNSQMRDWAERLVAQGYAVLMPDSYNPRGVPETCSRDQDLIRPDEERARDAAASLRWLQSQSWAAPSRVGLIGWASGGTTALNFATADGRVQGPSLYDFKVVIAFYPRCRVFADAPAWRSDMKLTILTGSADDWNPAADCAVLATSIRTRGGALDLVRYLGANHDFDAPDMPVHLKPGVVGASGAAATIGTDPIARADAVERVTTLLATTLRP